MPSLGAWLVRLYLVWIRRSKKVFSSHEATRQSMQHFYLRPDSYHPPAKLPGVTITRVDTGAWPLYRLSASPASSGSKGGALLYLHGGAFFREIAKPHWTLCAQVVRDTGLDVIVVIYPLLPSPVATAAKMADTMLEICTQLDQPIVSIAGDSAGGNLALVAAQQLVKRHPDLAQRVRSVVLIAPSLDSTAEDPEQRRLESVDPWLGVAVLEEFGPMRADGLALDDPLVSPLFGELEGLPPVLLFNGTHDLLLSDARRLSAKYQGKGTEKGIPGSYEDERLTYVEAPEMVHVYPLLPIPEGSQAREVMMRFISKHAQNPSA